MSRGQKCSVCASENVSQVNSLIAAGLKLKDIAAQLPGLSSHALSRHKRNCLAVAPTNSNGDLEEQQRSSFHIDQWIAQQFVLQRQTALNLLSQQRVCGRSHAPR
jgi:hypothetical protein